MRRWGKKMTKKAFDMIAAGLKDAIAIAQGTATSGAYRVHIPERVDVKMLRRRLGLARRPRSGRWS
jgi:putative transcriptional regulator